MCPEVLIILREVGRDGFASKEVSHCIVAICGSKCGWHYLGSVEGGGDSEKSGNLI